MRILLFVFLFIAICADSYAQDNYPKLGRAYSLGENSYIHYECYLEKGDLLSCTTTSANIHSNYKSSDSEKMIRDMKELYLNNPDEFSKATKELCEQAKNGEAILLGKRKPDMPEHFAAKSAQEKKEFSELVNMEIKLCNEPSLQNMLKIIDYTNETMKYTCGIYTWTVVQSFKRDIDGIWNALPKTEGLCGVISLDRFVPVKVFPDNNHVHWDFYSRKVVTKKDMKQNLCSHLDEREYKYSWAPRPISMECKHFMFEY